jgi:hypothetical protein
MRKIFASSFFHRFTGGFALGAVAMIALKPAEAASAILPLIG